MGQVILALFYMATMAVGVVAVLRLRARAEAAECRADSAEAAIGKLEAAHKCDMDDLQRDWDADNERLGRENFKLQTRIDMMRELNLCSECQRSKGEHQHGNNGNRVAQMVHPKR